MGVRQTSIDAYNYIKENGSLSTRRMEIYDVLFEHGPLTGGEIGRRLNEYRSAVSTADRNIHARLSELKKMQLISEVGTKTCEITEMNVILWDVTPNMPVKLEKKKTRTQIIKELENERSVLSRVTKTALEELSKANPVLADQLTKQLEGLNEASRQA